MIAERIGVVIPVHNEEDLVSTSVAALAVAVERVAVPVHITLVFDACSDSSRSRADTTANELGLVMDAVSIDARSVGQARSTGIDHLLTRLGEGGTWLATTDADSVVPPNWLVRHAELAAAGADVVAGTVVVHDWGPYSAAFGQHVTQQYARRRGPTHGHVHGANLAFAAPIYRAVGGFGYLTAHEDVRFVAAARALGLNIAWAEDIAVGTSARRNGRTPAGFARYLRRVEQRLVAQPAIP